MTPVEEPLDGGNMTQVVRVGDTVHRTAGPWTSTIHTYLRHVRGHGVTEVPEPFGLDEQGREVVSFLPGDVPGWPAPEWLWSEQILHEAGRLLRRLHDASLDLELRDLLGAMVERLEELAVFSEMRADGGGPPELREHAVMYRADADRVATLADAGPA